MRVSKNRRVTLAIVGALMVALAALTSYGYRQDINAARARVSSGSQVVNTPCGLIEYADVGKGPPVLVVHGAGGGFDQGLELAQPLIDSRFRVIACHVSGISALLSPQTHRQWLRPTHTLACSTC